MGGCCAHPQFRNFSYGKKQNIQITMLNFRNKSVAYALFPVLILYLVLMTIDVFFLEADHALLGAFRMSFPVSSGAVRWLDIGKGVFKKWRWFLPLYVLIVVLTPALAVPFILYDLLMLFWVILYNLGYKRLLNRVTASRRLASLKAKAAEASAVPESEILFGAWGQTVSGAAIKSADPTVLYKLPDDLPVLAQKAYNAFEGRRSLTHVRFAQDSKEGHEATFEFLNEDGEVVSLK